MLIAQLAVLLEGLAYDLFQLGGRVEFSSRTGTGVLFRMAS